MTMLKNNVKNERYFAAQNSYGGFISHFSEIFNSEKYERIFVLKGGPGTGKSSLMKKIAASLSSFCKITEIYCSSDIRSLDGVIAEGARGRVAILDGTAPHERDATIPGAIDELINLGEHWNTSELIKMRDTILDISKKKAKSYKNAYYNLTVAGRYNGLLRSEISARFDSYRAKEYLTQLAHGDNTEEPTKRSLLFSAFGKDGYVTLDYPHAECDSVVQITGEYLAPELFMGILSNELRRCGIAHREYPSALNVATTESIVIYDSGKRRCFTLLPAEEKISANQFLRPISATELQLQHYEKQMLHFQEEARAAFSEASQSHFALEKIYTPLMDFAAINAVGEKIIERASEIL